MAQGWVKLPRSASCERQKDVSMRISQYKENTDRAAQGTQFPIQHSDHPILCRVENQVIKFIIPMHDPQPCLLLVR